MKKEEMRKVFKRIRVDIKDKEVKSNIVCDKIIKSEFYNKSKVIGLYSSILGEVDTLRLIEESLKDGKIVGLPKVRGKELKFYRISKIEDLIFGEDFGIKEPKENIENLIDKNNMDLIIVPGVCFDEVKNRIGFGKGYYDRYLFDAKNVVKVGICFDEQVLRDSNIPVDRYDVKMDMIITNKKIIL